MIRHTLVELDLFEPKKATDNKLVWVSEVEGAEFRLYIPKWRVPEPWPARTCVGVFPRRRGGADLPNVTEADIQADTTLRHEPIVVTVEYVATHSKTIRYRPVGDKSDWEVGEPYIPLALTADSSQRLRLVVFWDGASRGMFPPGAALNAL